MLVITLAARNKLTAIEVNRIKTSDASFDIAALPQKVPGHVALTAQARRLVESDLMETLTARRRIMSRAAGQPSAARVLEESSV